jgi:hypothetical protein
MMFSFQGSQEEQMWERDLDSMPGWTKAVGKPKQLRDWVEKYNKSNLTNYRTVEINGVSEFAWNPNRFNPRVKGDRDYRWLAIFSEGVPRKKVVDLIHQRLGLPAVYLAEAVVSYWSQEMDLLLQQEDGAMTVSDELLQDLKQYQVYLENKDGLVSVQDIKDRFNLTETEIAEIFIEDMPTRIVTAEVILDLPLHGVNEEWVSKLISSDNVIPMEMVAEQIGINSIHISPEAAMEVARRVCAALNELYPSFGILEEKGGYLNIGNPKEVLQAHIRAAVKAKEEWAAHQLKQVERRISVEEYIDQTVIRLTKEENAASPDREDLVSQAIQAEFLKRYANRLIGGMG